MPAPGNEERQDGRTPQELRPIQVGLGEHEHIPIWSWKSVYETDVQPRELARSCFLIQLLGFHSPKLATNRLGCEGIDCPQSLPSDCVQNQAFDACPVLYFG